MPGFKFNLLSVSKITKELCCSVTFYPEFCTFQDLYSGKVIGIGREHEGLYWLQEDNAVKAGNAVKEQADSKLWHNRLGYPSIEVFNKIEDLNVNMSRTQQQLCIVCPMAKQSRLKFPISNSSVSSCFNLLHVDVWDHLRCLSMTESLIL